ncbi:MAG TPA: hypothetical protein VK763_06210 [Terriglobales bacterium]|jgi:hypothetical protein|nr:hypothetical protein [Terriglobales bacterium]
MNGYLQRLVLGVMRPAESIHPLVGSVFSPPKYGSEREAFLPEEDVLSRGGAESPVISWSEVQQRSHDPAPASDTNQKAPFPPSTPVKRQETSTKAGPMPGPDHLWAREPEPKAAPPQVHTVVHTPLMSRSAARSESQETPGHAETVLESGLDTLGEARNPTMVLKPVHVPLMNGNPGRSANHDTPSDKPYFLSAGTRQKEDRNLVRRPGPAERERDEIQIHIGRIEVTALPPSQARPAPQPLRKGLDLEEYLKRSDRRA